MVVTRYGTSCDVEQALSAMPGYRLKNKAMTADATELVAEMRLDAAGFEKLEQLRKEADVREITVMRSVTGSVL